MALFKMAAPISESWIRAKLNIQCDNLEDVRSLTLPGSYQEKISHLGPALRGFKRLKKLDLSRNSLETLDGLEQLKILEELNLYYNNISSLDELYKLRHHQQLLDLDLRLNPVTRTEADYRLFLIHMLPNLRRLDDRSVRDAERKAALQHFADDQAADFLDAPSAGTEDTKKTNPRVDYVNEFGSIPAVNADDCGLLDTVANHEYDMSRPRKVTGSSATQPHVESYHTPQLLDVVRREDDKLYNEEPVLERNFDNPQQSELHSKYPHIPPVPSDFHDRAPEPSEPSHPRDPEQEDWQMGSRGQAYFTPHPGGVSDACRPDDGFSVHLLPAKSPHRSPPRPQYLPTVDEDAPSRMVRYKPEHAAFLTELCNIVDRYWNGSGSLHKHPKFQSLGHSLISAFLDRQLDAESYVQDNRKLEDENHRLRQSLNLDSNVDIRETLNDHKKDVELLREKLKKTYDENQILQDKIDALQKENQNATRNSVVTADLERLRNDLEQEVRTLKARIHELDKVHQLTGMVQESHKTLLASNEQLRRELEESRHRHHSEVEQLHWSYNQLKKNATSLGSMGNISLDSSHRSHPHVNGGII